MVIDLKEKKNRKGFTLVFLVTFVLILSVVLSQISSTIIAYQNEKRQLIANTLEMNRINAEKLAITTDNILQTLKNSLAHTAEHLSDGISDQATIDLVRQSNNNFNSIFIAGNDGMVLSSSPSNIGLTGYLLTSHGVTQALNEKRPLISEPYIGATNRLIILISHPIYDRNGVYRGFVGARFT